MEPLFFGDSSSPLYGVYHAPETGAFSERGVLLCYPAGHEYMRIHRAYRQLASLLNRNGFHVLRFDYFGTGDSAGTQEQISISRWVDDVHHAVDELKSLSGVRQIDLVGLRLGSLVAAKAAAEIKSVKRLVLWEPMISGKQFVEEMEAHIEKRGESLSNFTDQSGCLNFHGYAFPKELLSSIESLSLDSTEWTNKVKTMVLSSYEASNLEEINQYLLEKSKKHYFSHVPGLKDWNALDAIGGLFLPMESVNEIANWLIDG